MEKLSNMRLILDISNVDKKDFGLYKCRFENSMGTVHNNVYLRGTVNFSESTYTSIE